MMRVTLLGVMIASAVVGEAAAQAPTHPLGQDFAQAQLMLTAGGKCGWLTLVEATALSATVNERLAAGKAHSAALLTTVNAEIGRAKAEGQTTACDGPQAANPQGYVTLKAQATVEVRRFFPGLCDERKAPGGEALRRPEAGDAGRRGLYRLLL